MMTNENIEDTLNNEGMPVPNVWVELEGEFLDFDKDNVIIGCNGSIIANNFYRRMLDEALQFDFQKIHWVFSKKPIAFGAGYIASTLILSCESIICTSGN